MMRSGSILLDMVISSLIGGVVIVMLMGSMAQFVSFDAVVRQSSLLMQQLVIIQHQLEKDLSGVFVPYRATIKEESQKKEVASSTPSSEVTSTTQQAKTEEKVKPLEQLFVATKDTQNQLAMLTFITNNPLAAYWQGNVGSPQPKRVRVVYTLQKEPERKDSYQLMRQEGADLTFETYKKSNTKAPRAYMLLDHIKSFSITFGYEEKIKKETAAPTNLPQNAPKAKATQKQEKTADTTFKKRDTWDSKVTTEKDSLFVSRIPSILFCTIELWNEGYTQSQEFFITIPLLSYGFNAQINPPKPAVQEQQPPQKPAPPKPTTESKETVQMEEKVFTLMLNENNQPVLVASDAPIKKKRPKKKERPTKIVNNQGRSFLNFNKLINKTNL